MAPSKKSNMTDAEKAEFDLRRAKATTVKRARQDLKALDGYDLLSEDVQGHMDEALVAAIDPYYVNAGQTAGARRAGLAAGAAVGGLDPDRRRLVSGPSSAPVAPLPPVGPAPLAAAPPPPGPVIDVPRSGEGLSRAFNIATAPGGNWEGFVAAFAAHFPPEVDRFLVICQLRAELGFLPH